MAPGNLDWILGDNGFVLMEVIPSACWWFVAASSIVVILATVAFLERREGKKAGKGQKKFLTAAVHEYRMRNVWHYITRVPHNVLLGVEPERVEQEQADASSTEEVTMSALIDGLLNDTHMQETNEADNNQGIIEEDGLIRSYRIARQRVLHDRIKKSMTPEELEQEKM